MYYVMDDIESKYDYGERQGWIKGKPRYYIEERIGCIAIIDSEKHDHKYSPGLHSDTPGVVWFKMGIEDKKPCKECGHIKQNGWSVSKEVIKETIIEADKLNDKL